MNKRSFLKSSLYFFGLISASKLAEKILIKNKSTICREVAIFYPKGKGFKDMQKDQKSWMNVSAWISFLSEAENKLILKSEKEILKDRVIFRFYFASLENLIKYEKLASNVSKINLQLRDYYGYRAIVKKYTLRSAYESQV